MTDAPSPKTSLIARLKTWARGIKRDVVTVYFAARDPQAPTGARLLAAVVAAYALSPIDLIPDFIPVLGYLDDLLIVPFGLLLVMRLMPDEVIANARVKADTLLAKPRSLWAAACFVAIWIALGFYLATWML
ncbi:hypothetical protein C5F52_09700 [Limnohabitans sp. TS-CS-82]|jgi:uncharacterized membrane protein YkvA (DUF1232 family)|uniref:YkvA family protein n=1 Tax=Limnohabitans sp. TS-CS-82 TaxID=2094193 RepID=UPI000CF230EC|nr:DUF1232 domain-containing protein [Limnohabitans sp. TS-CS-82]PQA83687.1 hypothetical protein C5F52_09700 [Limnohabitans sp. TS-CS-82]